MKLSTLDIILGFIILVLLIIIAVLVFMKEKYVGGYNSASGPVSGSGQLVVSATIDSNAVFSDKTNMMTFINYVHKIAPHVSIAFETIMDGTVPPGYSGNLQLKITSAPGNVVSRGVYIGKNSFFWDDAMNQFDNIIRQMGGLV